MIKVLSSPETLSSDLPGIAALRYRSVRFSVGQIEHIEKIYRDDPSILARLAILKRLASKPRVVTVKRSMVRALQR